MQVLSGGRLSTKLSFVLLLIDDFTGKPITTAEAVKIYIEDAPMTAAQVIKKDGYRAFTGFEGDEITLDIKSTHYVGRSVKVSKRLLDTKEPIELIRMYPNENYALPRGTTSVKFLVTDASGAPRPGFKMRMALSGGNLQYKLLDFAAAGAREIMFYNPDKSGLEGKGFLISDGENEINSKDNKTMEFITVVRQGEEYAATIKAPLEYDHDVGSGISVFYDCETDGNGLLYMPLNMRVGQCETAYFIFPSEKDKDKGKDKDKDKGKDKNKDIGNGKDKNKELGNDRDKNKDIGNDRDRDREYDLVKGKLQIVKRDIAAGCKNILETIIIQ